MLAARTYTSIGSFAEFQRAGSYFVPFGKYINILESLIITLQCFVQEDEKDREKHTFNLTWKGGVLVDQVGLGTPPEFVFLTCIRKENNCCFSHQGKSV